MKKLQELNNQATINKSDFTITKEGEAFISQRKLSDLLGLGKNAVNDWLRRVGDGRRVKLNETNQLSSESLEYAAGYFAFETAKPTKEAIVFYRLLAQAGAKAFIYHEAGMKFTAAPIVQELTVVQEIELRLIMAKEQEALRLDLANTQKSRRVITGKYGASVKANAKLKLALGISDDYVPIAIMRQRFPTFKCGANVLMRVSRVLGEDVKRTVALYTSMSRNQYSLKVWLEAYPELNNLMEQL